METGEFFIYFALITGTYFLADKIIKLIKWKLEYDVSVKKTIDELEAEIKKDDLQ